MALILSLESSTSVCSAAVHKDGLLLSSVDLHVPQSHASKLAVMISQVLSLADVDKEELSAVAIGSGPGSYTGLRIGSSLAKGLCFGLSIPLLAVNSLLVLARQVSSTGPNDALLCPMIDARRMEVYCLMADNALNILQGTAPVVVEKDTFAAWLSSNSVLFFGDGAMKCESVIQHPNASFIPGIESSAVHLGMLAYEKYRISDFENIHLFEPHYGKEYLAKIGKPLL